MSTTTLFLFRNDLRLQDNTALSAAIKTGQPIVLLYVFDDTDAHWPLGSASRWWLHHSLQSLVSSIHALGGSLILRRGNTRDILREIICSANVDKLFFSRMYEPFQCQLEEGIYQDWHDQIEVKRYGGYLLFEPEQIRTGQGDPYKVFTPFWKSCLTQTEPSVSRNSQLKQKSFYPDKLDSDKLESWGLLPTQPDWSTGFSRWQPGEKGAMHCFTRFLKSGIQNYDEDRDRPDRDGTSSLSPHLHFGEIAPARIWRDVKQAISNKKVKQSQAMCFLRELGWRDFSNHLLYHWSDLPNKAFRPEYQSFPWKRNQKALLAWQKGYTGYPIVDAGMRQLWQSGWMHNRVRMIVASFLVKHLLIHWRDGEEWFWDTLLDADLANNSASWQWVAGSGADAAPYFRIFNPILQGKKFDPDGDYVRHWVPELLKLPTKYIHEPWLADESSLAKAGIALGQDYPEPIVEHTTGRKRALAAFEAFKNG